MAFIKEYETKQKVLASYWRVKQVDADYDANRYEIKLYLYKDHASREGNATPLAVGLCWLPVDPNSDTISRALVYMAIKQSNIFIEGRNLPQLLIDAIDLE